MAKRKRSSVTTMLASGAEKANLEPSPPAVSADAADGSYSNNPNGLDGPDGGYVERDASYDVSESDIDSGEDCSSVVPPVECPFVVEYRSSAKRRRGSAISTKKTRRASTKLPNAAKKAGDNTGGPPKQQDLDQTFFEDNSTVYYVTPAKQWDALKKYRHFVVGEETFAINDYIFVNHQNIPPGSVLGPVDDTKFWVARVLEIKAVDEAHVYLRVYWFYWPEELPGGREYYHGKKELVASNHMEIIDAQTVSGRANVNHWFEKDDEEEDITELFWRQKFDYPSQTLMAVREHCRCHRYYNPDNIMVGCPKCETWLHAECLINDIKRKVIERGQPPPKTVEKLEKPSNDEKDADDSGDVSSETEPKKTLFKRKGGGGRRNSLLQAGSTNSFPVSTNSTKGVPNGKSKKKTKVEVANEMDLIDVAYSEGAPKAHIKDSRSLATKKGKSINSPRLEECDGNTLEWDEDVHCLVCDAVLE